MATEELRSNLKKMIGEIIEMEAFGDDEHFVRDLGVDSMMAIEIVARIEREYRVRFPETALRDVKTLNDVVSITENILAQSATERIA